MKTSSVVRAFGRVSGHRRCLRAAPLLLSPTPTHTNADVIPAIAWVTPARHLWNPFAKVVNPDGANPFSNPTVEKDIRSLNERLLAACLEVLAVCGETNAGGGAAAAAPTNAPPLDRHSKDTLYNLVDTFLHDMRRRPSEQFDAAYRALSLPIAAQQPHLRRQLLTVLECVLPHPLYHFFLNTDVLRAAREGGEERQEALLLFVHGMLGDVRVPRDSGLSEDEVLQVYIEDFTNAFPEATETEAFKELDLSRMALEARLFDLLGQLCAELDLERTGKVRLEDLRATAERVLGKEKTAMLLEGAVADEMGKIAYAQLTALLTRPPPQSQSNANKKAE